MNPELPVPNIPQLPTVSVKPTIRGISFSHSLLFYFFSPILQLGFGLDYESTAKKHRVQINPWKLLPFLLQPHPTPIYSIYTTLFQNPLLVVSAVATVVLHYKFHTFRTHLYTCVYRRRLLRFSCRGI